MNKSRKNYIKIDTATSTEEIFALLDNVNSDVENDIDASDTEFYVEEETYERNIFEKVVNLDILVELLL